MSNIKAVVKLMIPAGAATPAPPVGSALGPHGADRKGDTVPVIVTIKKDRTFTFVLKTSPTSELIRKSIKIQKGSSRPNTDKVGKITISQVTEIAKMKLVDLNTKDLEQAIKIVSGTARSMGVEVI
jgi:large subunit ribosomal protein L11